MKWSTGVLAAFLLACLVQRAEGQVVALQTADPSCRDDSGNIYVDCGNGTVTDNRTGLVWLKNANCLSGIVGSGPVDWQTAMEFVAGLSDIPATSAAAAHDCGLSDGSSPGEWRLPSIAEWEAMIADALGVAGDPDCTLDPPTITNDSGQQCWADGPSSFTVVSQSFYWSSTPYVFNTSNAWDVHLFNGSILFLSKANPDRVWPVRGGQ